MIEIYV